MAQENIEVVMPQMGEAITEATISVWHKKEGDEVEEGEALLDISTAKVEVDLPAPQSGVLAKILHQEGETVPVDTLIAVMAPPGTDLSNFHYEPNGSENAVREAPEPREHTGTEEKRNSEGRARGAPAGKRGASRNGAGRAKRSGPGARTRTPDEAPQLAPGAQHGQGAED
jgi:pyruvate/2-oxoglutarate dehydrogenase complex dihydrolipoamide acyltransferase (E2) component